MVFSELQKKFIEKFENWVHNDCIPNLKNDVFSYKYSRKENESFYYFFLDIESYNDCDSTTFNDRISYIKHLYSKGFSFESLIHDRMSNVNNFESLYKNIEQHSLIIRISKKYKSLEFSSNTSYFNFVKTSDRRKKNFRDLNKYFFKKYFLKKIKISKNDKVIVYNRFKQPRYISYKNIYTLCNSIPYSIFFNFPIFYFLDFLLKGHLEIKETFQSEKENFYLSNKFVRGSNDVRHIIEKINPIFGESQIYKMLYERIGFEDVFLLSRIFDIETSKEFLKFYNDFIIDKSYSSGLKNLLDRRTGKWMNKIYSIVLLFILKKNNYLKIQYNSGCLDVEKFRLNEKQIDDVERYLETVDNYVGVDFIYHIETNLKNQFLIFMAQQNIMTKEILLNKNTKEPFKFFKKHENKIENILKKEGVSITFMKKNNQILKTLNEYPFLNCFSNCFLEVIVPDKQIRFIISINMEIINLHSAFSEASRKIYFHSSVDIQKNKKDINSLVFKIINELLSIYNTEKNKKKLKGIKKQQQIYDTISSIPVLEESDLPF